MKVDIEYHILC